MIDDIMGFDSSHPRYKELQKVIREKSKPQQDEYTNLVDRIAINKIKRLSKADD